MVGVTVISAQVPTDAVATQIESSQSIDIESQRQVFRQQYRIQIQAYQEMYRQFSVVKSQFQKLETLASLEEAIVGTREVMRARDELLIAYLDLLYFELQVSPSYQEETKQEFLNRITQLKNNLVTFNQLVLNSQDRQAIAERVVGFVALGEELQELSFQTRKIIFLGKFRASAGMAQQLTQEVKNTHEQFPVSALKQGERQRAYQELDSIETVVQSAWDKSILAYSDEKSYYADSYSRFVVTLSPIQTGLIRWYALLEQSSQL